MTEKILADRYRLVEKIGEGGMAMVYRAIDLKTQHSVAIKVLKKELAQDQSYVERFQREAEAASRMTHHNIVNLLDVGMDGDNRFLVMEFVEGMTLKKLIAERGRLGYQTAVEITIRILSALSHAHENGIIHRDIKPQNILVSNDRHIKVADFGIARMADSATLTHDNSVMGTVYYYSPEQASGQPALPASDLYSVGVVLYEMLTGHVPFTGDSQVAIAMQHLQTPPPPIELDAPDVPYAVCQVCMTAMAKNARARYQSAREMAQQLQLALEGKPVAVSPTVALPSPEPYVEPSVATDADETGRKKKRRRHRRINVLWWVVTAIGVALVSYGLFVGASSIYEKVVNSASVPDFVGVEVTQAERMAARAGLEIETIEINHPTVASGIVIMQAPDGETELRKGDRVLLTVSRGPATQAMPSIVGMTLTDAIAATQNYGLTLTVVEHVMTTDVQAGFILAQVPEAGTPMKNGDFVQVRVSGGLVNVPVFRDMTVTAAKALAELNNLTVSGSINYIPTDDAALHGTVAAQSPEAETQVIQSTAVVLSVYSYEPNTRACEVPLELPTSEVTINVRVTMVENGIESTVWEGHVDPMDSRNPSVRFKAQNAGNYVYKVYMNNKFLYQQQLTMK